MFAGEQREKFEPVDGVITMTVLITALLSAVLFVVFFGRIIDISVIAAGLQ